MQNYPVVRRRFFSGLIGAVLPLAAASFMMLSGPAEAQTYDPRYPVCMTLYSGPFGGEWHDCSYETLPQCQATASGRAAICGLNPYFVQAPDLPLRPHRRHHRAG